MIPTRLVDTVSTSMLLNILQSRRIDPKQPITHRFRPDKILDVHKTFKCERYAALEVSLSQYIHASRG